MTNNSPSDTLLLELYDRLPVGSILIVTTPQAADAIKAALAAYPNIYISTSDNIADKTACIYVKSE